MRKIFLFLFAAVLSIGTASAYDLVIPEGEFMKSYGSWVVVGDADYSLLLEPYGFDPSDPQTEYFCAWNVGDYYAAGECTFTATLDEESGSITFEGTGVSEMGETEGEEYHMIITALLPDPNAVPEVEMYFDVTANNLQVTEESGALMLTATDNTFMMGALNLTLMLTTTETPDVYEIADAYIATQGQWGRGTEFAFISGTMTKTTDPDKGDVYTGEIITSMEGMGVALNVELYYVEPKTVDIVIEDATISYNYALQFKATLDGVEYYAELYGYTYNGELNNEVLSDDAIGMFEITEDDFGSTDEVTVTVDANKKITVEGVYVSANTGNTYNVKISGTLPTYTITLDCSLAGATVTGAGTYVCSQIVDINVTLPTPWKFTTWTDQYGTTFWTEASYDFEASKDLQLTANYILELTEGDNSAVVSQNGLVGNVKVLRGFEPDKLYTIALPFAINNVTSVFGTGTVIYEYANLAKDKNGELVIGFKTVNKIEAGKPYLIIPKKTIRYWLGFTVDNVTISSTETPISYSVDGTTVTMTPVMSAITSNGGKYWLAEDTWLYNDETEVSGLRALFNITTRGGIAPRARVALGENETTGVDNVVTGAEVVKTIENGQLIIIRNGEKFNVQGIKL